MAKPTKVPTWATDADYSNGPEVGTPTKADPGAGVQAEGYIPQTRLAAQVINWWKNLVGQWVGWLDGHLDETGGRLDLTTGFRSLANSEIQGDLDLTGAVSAGGAISSSASVSAGTNVTAGASVQAGTTVVAPNQGFLWAGGPISRTVRVNHALFRAISGTVTLNVTNGRIEMTGSGRFVLPLALPHGSTLTGVSVTGPRVAGGSITTTLRICNPLVVGSAITNTGSGGNFNNTATGLSIAISNTGSSFYFLDFETTDMVDVESMTITYSDPGPRNH